MNITIDPEFKALIPPLAPEELAQLESNIVKDGCRDPLVIWEAFSVLMDGHNRHEICTRHGIPFETVKMEIADRTAAMLWIIDNQFGRRNLPSLTRVQLMEMRKHLVESRQGQRTDLLPTSDENSHKVKIKPSEKLAEMAGVGKDTYRACKLILDAEEKGEITPEVAQAVRQNKIAVHRVAKDIKETRQKAAREEKRVEAVKDAPMPEGLIVGDFREHSDKVPDGSISLIFTDPPYDKEAEKLFVGLADFAKKKLCEGGSLLMYLGHLQLPAAFKAFEGKMRHWWTCACVHGGDKALMREYGIRVGWKPMLWFVKQTRDDKTNIVFDIVSGAGEKQFHDWQQDQSDAEYYIKELCPKDGVVCDPFIGGGTTAVAAKALGRKWVGFEINEDTAKVAGSRIGL